MDKKQGPFRPGDHFKDWVITRLIGSGGHAYVYEAQNTFTKVDVAIKIIPSPRDSGRDLVERARSEARVLARIHHDNIVRVTHASVTEEGLVYLVMDLLHGRDLRKVINQHGRLSVAEALVVIQQVSAGVAAAHRESAIHRDLKPENIFIESENRVKVLDFGVAKVMGYGAQTTEKDLLHGTVLYMSPEQLKGFGVTARSDIFALGTIAYEALQRHPALLGKELPTFEEIGWAQIERQPPLLSEIDRTIPSYVARLIDKAIMKNPEQRFQSMDEMSGAAREVLDRYFKEAEASRKVVSLRPLWEDASPDPHRAVGPDAVAGAGDTDVVTRPPFSVPPQTPRQRSPNALLVKPDSASQLTPPPTTSGISGDTPGAGRISRRPVLLVVGTAASLGLALGAGIMWRGSASTHAAEPSSVPPASAAPANRAADIRDSSLLGVPPGASLVPAPEPPPASTAANSVVAVPQAAAPATPFAKSDKPARAAPAAPAAAASKAMPRSEMEERMRWLEQDLKVKPAAPASSGKVVLPSSGLD